jgi:twin BRCT domain
MGKGFKNVNASFVGNLEHGDKIPRWLKANGGIYSRNVDESVTHLIATESAVKDNVDAGTDLLTSSL